MIKGSAASLIARIIATTDPTHFDDDLEYIARVNSLLDTAVDNGIDIELILLRLKELRYDKFVEQT